MNLAPYHGGKVQITLRSVNTVRMLGIPSNPQGTLRLVKVVSAFWTRLVMLAMMVVIVVVSGHGDDG